MISALMKSPGSGKLLKVITWLRATGAEKFPWISSVSPTWDAIVVEDIVLDFRVMGNGPKPTPGQEKVHARVLLYGKNNGK
jgi:hypothetical protein